MHHILVLPSIAEGTPLVIQEAMLKGRPILATDVGGNSKLVIDGETGLLAATASVSCLKEKLDQLFAMSLSELQLMGGRAFDRAKGMININSSKNILQDIENG